jgi:hypothetical protein
MARPARREEDVRFRSSGQEGEHREFDCRIYKPSSELVDSKPCPFTYVACLFPTHEFAETTGAERRITPPANHEPADTRLANFTDITNFASPG